MAGLVFKFSPTESSKPTLRMVAKKVRLGDVPIDCQVYLFYFHRLRILLNYIAITRKIGIRIERYAIAKIPRFGPHHGLWAPSEGMIPPLTTGEIRRFVKLFSVSPEIHEIADGLNNVYLLTSLNSRLSTLWAITEAVFTDKPQPLLSNDEIKFILSSAIKIKTLTGTTRLKELEHALKDPNRLPLKSRNRRISDNIAKTLNLNVENVYQEIMNASRVRGKYLHELKTDIGKMRQAEEYLRTTLEKHLEMKMKQNVAIARKVDSNTND